VGLLFITILGIPFAIYLGVGWALFYQAIIVERLGGRAALSRSSGLVGGNRWRVLGTSILMSILTSILVSLPTVLVGMFTGAVAIATSVGERDATITLMQDANGLASAVAQSLFGSLALITNTVLYYELRVRKEAFDLEQRAVPVDAPPQAPDSGG